MIYCIIFHIITLLSFRLRGMEPTRVATLQLLVSILIFLDQGRSLGQNVFTGTSPMSITGKRNFKCKSWHQKIAPSKSRFEWLLNDVDFYRKRRYQLYAVFTNVDSKSWWFLIFWFSFWWNEGCNDNQKLPSRTDRNGTTWRRNIEGQWRKNCLHWRHLWYTREISSFNRNYSSQAT